jgi:hypothetical protein
MYTSPSLRQLDFSRWVDVPFIVEADATGNARGCLPDPDASRSKLDASLPVYEASFPIYPREQWPDLIAERDAGGGAGWAYQRIQRQKNQGREGSCVYNMLAQLQEIAWNRQFGDDAWIPWSPMSGYRWNARSAGSGSNTADSILWSEKRGLLPENTPANLALVAQGLFGHTHPATGWDAKFAAGWEQTAKLFRAMPQTKGGWYRVTTVEGWFSASFDGNAEGGGRDGHALCHAGAALDGNQVFSVYCNSWGKWGATLTTTAGPIQAFGFDSEAKVRSMVARGAFVLVNVRRPSFLDRWTVAA